MSKISLILVVGIWCAIVVPSLWIRHRNSKLSSQELKEKRQKWRNRWSGNALGIIILKGLLLIGMLCCAANALLRTRGGQALRNHCKIGICAFWRDVGVWGWGVKAVEADWIGCAADLPQSAGEAVGQPWEADAVA